VFPSIKEKAEREMEKIDSATGYVREKWHIIEGDITKANLSLSAKFGR
jgi:hypothetical protein